jgi:exopolyphosphatase/guanosine-5'-triphosphate,3'-diphosphate pyrophosphatase
VNEPVRVAALDCGTNTFRLYVADVFADGAQQQLVREVEIVRLGQGVDATGMISPVSMQRALDTAARYSALIKEYAPSAIRMVATSASRDAMNAHEFVAGIEATIGVTPEVIPGEEEAALAFAGATRGLGSKFDGPFLVVDLGGGSTELVLGEVNGSTNVRAAYSMDVGSVRLTERYLKSDPPTAAQIAQAHDETALHLAMASRHVPLGQTRTIVGVAGTVTSLAAYHLGLQVFDPRVVDNTVNTLDEVAQRTSEMLNMTRAERMALGFLQPGRADIIGAGALIWGDVVSTVAEAVRADDAAAANRMRVVTRESDMLEGIAADLAGR